MTCRLSCYATGKGRVHKRHYEEANWGRPIDAYKPVIYGLARKRLKDLGITQRVTIMPMSMKRDGKSGGF